MLTFVVCLLDHISWLIMRTTFGDLLLEQMCHESWRKEAKQGQSIRIELQREGIQGKEHNHSLYKGGGESTEEERGKREQQLSFSYHCFYIFLSRLFSYCHVFVNPHYLVKYKYKHNPSGRSQIGEPLKSCVVYTFWDHFPWEAFHQTPSIKRKISKN